MVVQYEPQMAINSKEKHMINPDKCPYPELDCKTCREREMELPEYCFHIYN